MSIRFSPIAIPTSLKRSFNLLHFSLNVSDTLAYASAAAPDESTIPFNSSLNPAAPSFANINAALPASELLNNSFNPTPDSSACCFKISNTSPVDIPSAVNSLNDLPVLLINISDTSDPESPSSSNMDFNLVPDSDVEIPFAVNIAYEAPNWSILTPKLEAIGITCPIEDAS